MAMHGAPRRGLGLCGTTPQRDPIPHHTTPWEHMCSKDKACVSLAGVTAAAVVPLVVVALVLALVLSSLHQPRRSLVTHFVGCTEQRFV